MGFLTPHPVVLKPKFAQDPVAQSVKALIDTCDAHQGGGTVPLNAFLLSLYDGETWAPDLQLLCRRIDPDAFEHVIKIMRGYAERGIELHKYFANGGALFESIARKVPMRKRGGFCNDNEVLDFEAYLDAVADRLAPVFGEIDAARMVERAKAGGFFNAHVDRPDMRRRVRIGEDAEKIEQQCERDKQFLADAGALLFTFPLDD